MIAIAVAFDSSGQPQGRPAFSMAGLPIEKEREAFIDEAVDAARDAARKGAKDMEKLREAVRLAVRRTATDWTGKKPVVTVSFIEV
jgi:ribonuclease J